MPKADRPIYHCDLCRQIAESCAAEVEAFAAGKLERCKVCGNTGLVVLADEGRAIVCDACPRGIRMKLWLRHERHNLEDFPEIEAP